MLNKIDNIVTRVPKTFVKSAKKLNKFLKEDLSLKHGVVLKKNINFIDENLIKKIMLPIFIFALIEGIEGISLWLRNKKLNFQKDTIFKSYNLPSTSFQNIAILRKLREDIKYQQNIRRFISVLLNAPFGKGEFIKNFDLDNYKASVMIKLEDVSNLKKYKNFFLNYINFATVTKTRVKNNTLIVEFRL